MSILLVLLYMRYGISGEFFSYSFLLIFVFAAALIDIKKRIIPDRLVLFGAGAGMVFFFFNSEITLLSSLIAVLSIGGVLWAVSALSKGALGMGDVKLLACIGLFLGFEKSMSMLLVSTVLSGLTGLFLLIKSRDNRKKDIPFAPFIFLGVVLTLLIQI